MYSIIATAALFTAVVLNDFLKKRRNPYKTKQHIFFGIMAVTAMTVLWYLDMEIVGWGLLIVPIGAIFLSFLLLDSSTYMNAPSAYIPPAPSANIPHAPTIVATNGTPTNIATVQTPAPKYTPIHAKC